MDDLQIGLSDDNGEIKGYRIDSEIIEGLYITVTPDKIKRNCKEFDVVLQGEGSKISKRNNVSIFTLEIDEENQLQYLVGEDMDVKKLKSLDNKQLPEELKSGILHAFELTKINRLGDL